MMSKMDDPEVHELVLAARSAALHLDAEVFSFKQGLRPSDGKGNLLPLDRRKLSRDDLSWLESDERRFRRLNAALAAFGMALSNPASS